MIKPLIGISGRHGLLWAYNLNYFEFLEQEGLSAAQGFNLIDDFWAQYEDLKVAHDPYPISLRLIFWIRFMVRQDKSPEEKYLRALHQQAKELQTKLEYHLLGNHLLENAFALFITGCYLKEESLTTAGKELLQKELKEQILPDGGHFELSPMYHQLVLYRLLDSINIAQTSGNFVPSDVYSLLKETAGRMLGWMQQMSFSNGQFPLFNDAANGIAPRPKALTAYARRLGIDANKLPLKESGYRKWTGDAYELIMDVGAPGPPYQPGHAHCDIFNFELYVKGHPVIVDTGISVYGGYPEIRHRERCTAAHNTVQIDGLEQSEIWAEFRMARRAKVSLEHESDTLIKASHNGFYFKKIAHTRTFKRQDKTMTLIDKIRDTSTGIAYFHFHPDVSLKQTGKDTFVFEQGSLSFSNFGKIEIQSYRFAPEFGRRLKAQVLAVHFTDELHTELKLS